MRELMEYIQEKEEILPLLSDLSEEVHQAALETERLIQVSAELEEAFSSIVGKNATPR